MRSRTTETRRLARVLPTLAVAGLILGVATRASAECTSKSYKMVLPDRSSLRLSDGQHMIGAVQTVLGSFEARVDVRGGVVSANRYFVGGRMLSEVSESALPVGLRDCLKTAPSSGAAPETMFAKAIRTALDWIVAPANASTVRGSSAIDVFIIESCFKGTKAQQVCTYRACASDGLTDKTTCVRLFTTGA